MFGAYGLGEAPPAAHFYPETSSFQNGSAPFVPAPTTPSSSSSPSAAVVSTANDRAAPSAANSSGMARGDFKAAVQNLIFGARVQKQADYAQFAGAFGIAQLETLENKIDSLVSNKIESELDNEELDNMLDTNNDGIVTNEELVEAGNAAFGGVDEEGALDNMLDTNHDGVITNEELVEAGNAAFGGVDEEGALDNMLDTNHDGVITNEELVEAGDAAFQNSNPGSAGATTLHAGDIIYGSASAAPASPPARPSASPIYAVVNKPGHASVSAPREAARTSFSGKVSEAVLQRWRKASARDVASIAAALVVDARRMQEMQSDDGSLVEQLKADRRALSKTLSDTQMQLSQAVNEGDAARMDLDMQEQQKLYKRQSVVDIDKQVAALAEDERRLREMLHADIIKSAKSQMEGAADSFSSKAAVLVLGTINIIGDAMNPIEFEPNAVDLADVTGGAEAFAAAKQQASAAMCTCTVSKCLAAVANSSISPKLQAFVESSGFNGTESVAALCSAKKLDLGLDNKWIEERLNPIVFGMACMPNDPTMLQINHVSTQPGLYMEALVGYYVNHWPAQASAELEASVNGLLMWDLCCAAAVASAAPAFATLVEASYLWGTTEPRPKELLLRTLFYPLAKSIRKHAGAAFIIGCQEMPHEQGALESALPVGMTVYRAPVKSGGLISGFVFSEELASNFADVSEQLRPELTGWLRDQGIDEKIISTTISRLVCAQFDVPEVGKLAVLVFHCKSFKKLAEKQGMFVAHSLARAESMFGMAAYAVGDMNLEAKWPKGTKPADMRAQLNAAKSGMLPKSVISNTLAFGSSLTAGGYAAYPAAGTITTLKMRTQFQGQPEKDGDLTAVHKDFVITPDSKAVLSVEVAGVPDSFTNNLGLLQPSKQWPADHFGIFVAL